MNICSDIDKFHKYFAESKKPDKKEYIVYVLHTTCMKFRGKRKTKLW